MTVLLFSIKIIALLLLLVVVILIITVVALTLQIRRLAVDSQHNIRSALQQVVDRVKTRISNHKKRKFRHGKIVRQKKRK